MEELLNNKPVGGVVQTNDPIDQPDNTLTFALNGILDSVEGSNLSIQSEPGNEECYTLPEGYVSVGYTHGDANDIYIFSTDGESSEIGLSNNCKYETIINDSCLNFSTCNKVRATYRKKNGCDRNLYFVDGNNPDRYINIDDLDYFMDGESLDCNKIKMSPDLDSICIEAIEIKDSGGQIGLGVVKWAVEVLDKDENIVHTSLLSSGVAIVDGDGTQDWYQIEGGYNVGVDELLGPKSKTNKSVVLRISNLNPDFPFIRLIAVVAESGDGVTYTAYKKGDLVSVTNNFVNYTFTGFSVSNGDYYIDVADVLVPDAVYETSEAIGQVQNRLVRANLKNPSVELSELYRASSKVGLRYKIKELTSHEVIPGSPKDGLTWFDSSSFMGDEVYGFGIVYQYTNGYLSPSIPLIGRPKNHDSCDCAELTAEGGTKTITYTNKCFKIFIDSTINLTVNYTITVKWKVNGVEHEKVETDFAWDENVSNEFKIYCDEASRFDAEVSDISYKVELDDPLLEPYIRSKLEFTTSTTTSKQRGSFVGKAPLNGWDDTVYPYWFEDLSHLVTEEEYKDIIESVGGIYGDSGSAMSLDNLNLLRDTLPDYQRWRIFNTSIKLTDDSGILGYYECLNTTYPEILDCDGNSIWGNDCTDKPIAGQRIRHFRMPDRALEPHYIEETITNDNEPDPGIVRLIGIEACNIEYPNPDIVGHYIVMMERLEEDRTVLDKGWGHRMNSHSEDNQYGFNYMMGKRFQPQKVWFMHPELAFRDRPANGDYLKIEGEALATRFRPDGNCTYLKEETKDPEVHIGGIYAVMGGLQPLDEINIGINSGRRMPIMSVGSDVFGEEGQLLNLSHSNQVIGYELNRDFPESKGGLGFKGDLNFIYSGVKVIKDVYCNIFNRKYFKIHSCMKTLDDEQVFFGGDTHISQWNISNLATVDLEPGILSIVLGAILTVVGLALLPIGGAALVVAGIGIAVGAFAYAAYALTSRMLSDGVFDGFINYDELDGDPPRIKGMCDDRTRVNHVLYSGEHVNNLWTESDVNTSIRHSAGFECNTYYSQYPGFQSLRQYFQNRIVELVDPNSRGDAYQIRPVICPEVYYYNDDFSLKGWGNAFFSLPVSYDFCNKCDEVYENRVIWSEKSFDSDKLDNYRITLPNNFKDVSANKGAITDLEAKSNQLLVHTPQTTLILRPNPQTLQTDVSNIYIGTGDFLALDPVDLVETNVGYGGKQSKYSGVNTEFGYFWIDEWRGNILNFNSNIQKIGGEHLSQWLKENLPIKFQEQVKCFTGLDYNCDKLGVITTFDPRFDRLLISKRDYELKKEYEENFTVTDGEVYIDGELVEFTNPEYFINKSFTLSYDIKRQVMGGWHSYLPDMMYFDNNNFYSTVNNKAWRHLHTGNFQTFYGVKYDFIIEPVVKDYVTKNLHSLIYVGLTKEYDNLNNKWVEKPELTFDRGMVYNTCQSSGLFDIEFLNQHTNPYGNLLYDSSTKYVTNTDKNYKVSQIFDLSSAQPTTTADWDNLDFRDKFYVDGVSGYIDCVGLESNLDRENVYNIAIPKDKWVKARLYFKPEEDVKKVVYLTSFNEHSSIR